MTPVMIVAKGKKDKRLFSLTAIHSILHLMLLNEGVLWLELYSLGLNARLSLSFTASVGVQYDLCSFTEAICGYCCNRQDAALYLCL